MMIGGRYLGPAGGPPGRVTVQVEGSPLSEIVVRPDHPWFVAWLGLPTGLPEGSDVYAHLTVRVSSDSGGASPMVGLEQFDVAAVNAPMFALMDGWHEAESDPTTGRQWRWSSDRSTIEVRGSTRSATLTLAGESPLKNTDQAPRVTVRAGRQVLGAFTLSDDFRLSVPIPAEALDVASGLITIETSVTFRPSDQGSPDRRVLGLRLWDVRVN
jgi:hypothetical protein